jgi:anti-sigma factor RsiW
VKTALTCRELVELVTEYLEGTLSSRDRVRFERHIDGCDGCTAYLEQFRETIRLTGTLRAEQLDPAALETLLAQFRDWNAAGT